MKVLDLRCANGHGFEGWFGSDEDYMGQNGRGLIECPLCADKVISRLPSAPRLNLSGARSEPQQRREPEAAKADSSEPAAGATSSAGGPVLPAELQAAWMNTVRQMMARTEDVGPRFAEEARRIHYGETPERGIRGKATEAERAALQDEGIETFSLPVPRALEGPLQ
jgi:hypothetical protein